MTEDMTVDQSVIYRDYLETVTAFNLANTQYLKTADKITTQRQRAIQQAIEIHIDPVLDNLRRIQAASAIVLVGLFLLYCVSSAGRTPDRSVFLFFLIMALFGVGVTAIAVLIWSSSKTTDLVRTKNSAIEMGPPAIQDKVTPNAKTRDRQN